MIEQKKLPLVVLISGSGSNLQAIIDGAAADLPVEIRAVISNRTDAYGLERARKAGIATKVLDHKDYADREGYDQALGDLIETYEPGLVILAGFMRILSAEFVSRFHGRMFNIHPSLLPKYRGLHTHKRALDANDELHGASVHFVTEELDGGPLVLQVNVPVEEDDTEESLAARVLTQEHIIYPTAIRWFAEGRLKMNGSQVVKDGIPLDGPVTMSYQEPPPS
ncbi:phosphoribosylglycinamide formyltransferase [Solemya velesiana gill symbiont]|uniref:Phosphoribosylglycinamide formyltransferase n=1 Tax=Solemya velesiana gill symbiont TaxID=1918948 RepID=A0A1T2KPG7_9GAMM|nr:phosphoribosylglycinamide formyltransferase [Solemya velesiana gill symbiont]OOZ34764.1 phosphoribosylglycinamide formyltransferase [Solemya velesiana gill symbiont]